MSWRHSWNFQIFISTPTTMCPLIAYICVYYNGEICITNEGTTFISNNTKNFMINKVITLTQLLELVLQKINIESHQLIQELCFRCPIFEPGQSYMYTCFILGDDVDVQQMFNIFYNNPTLPLMELFAIICDNNNLSNNQYDSTSNVNNLLFQYKSCWVKDHGSDSDSSSGPEGCNLSPSHEPIFKRSW